MSIEISESYEFNEPSLIELYRNSFPAVERRPIENLSEMIKNDENYHLYIVKQDNLTIGFALVYEFVDEKLALLDYMVINDSFQKKGIGSKLFQYCIDAVQVKHSPLGLLLEIQRDDVEDLDEQKMRKDRIHFYKKFNAKTFENVEYFIPPQYGVTPEKLYLMIIPFTQLDSFPKEIVENIVKKTHLEIYHSQRNDIIENIINSLTDTIRLI